MSLGKPPTMLDMAHAAVSVEFFACSVHRQAVRTKSLSDDAALHDLDPIEGAFQ